MASIARTSTGLEGAILIHPDGTVVTGAGTGGGGGSTSVWSAADAAANGMTLSNGGLTVTPSGAAAEKPMEPRAVWQSIRTSISKTTGKLYVEFKNTVAASDALIAVGLGNSTINIAVLLGNSNNYSCSSVFNGVGNYISMGAGATDHYQIPYTTAAANDVFAIAIDLDAGKYWLARNNVWYGSGDPGAGINHIMNYTPATVGALFPAMSFNGAGQGVWTLQPTAASQKYAPPSGFTAWDGGVAPPPTSVWSSSDATANGVTLTNNGLTVSSLPLPLVWLEKHTKHDQPY